MDTKSTDSKNKRGKKNIKNIVIKLKSLLLFIRGKLSFISPYVLIFLAISGVMYLNYGVEYNNLETTLDRQPSYYSRQEFFKEQWKSREANDISTRVYKETEYLNAFDTMEQSQLNDISSKFLSDDYTKFLVYNRKSKKIVTNIDSILSLLVSDSSAKNVEDILGKLNDTRGNLSGNTTEDKLKNLVRRDCNNDDIVFCLTSSGSPAVQYFSDHLKYIKNSQDYLEIFYPTQEGRNLNSQTIQEYDDPSRGIKWSDVQHAWDKQQQWEIRIWISIFFILLAGIKNTFASFKVCAPVRWGKIFISSVGDFFNAKTLAYKYIGFLVVSIIAVLSAFIAVLAGSQNEFIPGFIAVIIPVVYIFYILPKTFKFITSLYKIVEGSEKIVEGDLTYSLEEDKGEGNLQRLAKSINTLRKGFKVSIDEQVKNERLKSELVANVSHDLKTPLTSIINYTDILMREGLTEEEKQDYLQILNRKSLKLKDLIEALFEVSKMNSGKIDLEKTDVNVIELLNQSIGEFATSAEQKGLRFKLNTFSNEVTMSLDGKKMARVFENLISNSIKYSLENTRVFVEVYKTELGIKIAFKNISCYEMDFDENEIFERFTRGDKSRKSDIDGNGLGLAIANSIVDLHGGTMSVEKDGDMFKVFVSLNNLVKEEKF